MGATYTRNTPVPREFDCKMCGTRVCVNETADHRTVFCCEHCEKTYWKHADRYERKKNINQGHVIHRWQLKERDEYAL